MTSSAGYEYESPVTRPETIEEQVRRKGIRPIEAIEDLAQDGIFESDEEVEQFLAYIYAARHADLLTRQRIGSLGLTLPFMLWELSVTEQRYRAVLEVLAGVPVTESSGAPPPVADPGRGGVGSMRAAPGSPAVGSEAAGVRTGTSHQTCPGHRGHAARCP